MLANFSFWSCTQELVLMVMLWADELSGIESRAERDANDSVLIIHAET